MKTLNFTAAAVLVIAIFYVLIVGEALLLPLVVSIALWYLISLLAGGFQRIPLGHSPYRGRFACWLQS